MLSQAFRCRVIGVGNLMRGELRMQRPRGINAAQTMARGELLEDALVMQVVREALMTKSGQSRGDGWLLDGLPRTISQAHALMTDKNMRPDAVIILERPDELVMEIALGRCFDATTGQTYHPIYAPPPQDVRERLTWRIDDTPETIRKRLEEHRSTANRIFEAFDQESIPVKRVNNAQSELQTFAEIATFLKLIGCDKLSRLSDGIYRDMCKRDAQLSWGAEGCLRQDTSIGGAYCGQEYQRGRLSKSTALQGAMQLVKEESGEEEDIVPFCEASEDEGECMIRYQKDIQSGEAQVSLLNVVTRCNAYNISDFTPVYIDDRQVGWVNDVTLSVLFAPLASGSMCELVVDTASDNMGISQSIIRLAPNAMTSRARTMIVDALVRDLVSDGLIPKSKLRYEMQDVFDSQVLDSQICPMLQIERAAVIYFGFRRFGVHVNGWVRDPTKPHVPQPWAMWIAKRSMSKPTYPGLLDQMVAGGQPSGLTYEENVRKECEEEASLPPEIIAKLDAAGSVSYKYATPKGLSRCTLMTYDLELDNGTVPLCADGEIEEFELVHLTEVMRSLREELPRWRPNSALVALDFLVRHGLVDASNEPNFADIEAALSATPSDL